MMQNTIMFTYMKYLPSAYWGVKGIPSYNGHNLMQEPVFQEHLWLGKTWTQSPRRASKRSPAISDWSGLLSESPCSSDSLGSILAHIFPTCCEHLQRFSKLPWPESLQLVLGLNSTLCELSRVFQQMIIHPASKIFHIHFKSLGVQACFGRMTEFQGFFW